MVRGIEYARSVPPAVVRAEGVGGPQRGRCAARWEDPDDAGGPEAADGEPLLTEADMAEVFRRRVKLGLIPAA